jgi:cytidylate kinase
MFKNIVIAIDGPAASGKSTTAKRIAEKLDLLFIDTGAMYRAATLLSLEAKCDLNNEENIISAVHSKNISQKNIEGMTLTFAGDRDVSEAIRTREVTNNVSKVAAYKSVRAILVEKQQEMGGRGNVILDGRDIGTVVFPNADLKIFMIATAEERAKRRLKEFEEKGEKVELSKLIEEINERDRQDAEREASPLKKADDAVEVDTSKLTIDEQVELIINLTKKIY